jgi:hypothetical protein
LRWWFPHNPEAGAVSKISMISLGGEKMAPSVLVTGGAIHFSRGATRC